MPRKEYMKLSYKAFESRMNTESIFRTLWGIFIALSFAALFPIPVFCTVIIPPGILLFQIHLSTLVMFILPTILLPLFIALLIAFILRGTRHSFCKAHAKEKIDSTSADANLSYSNTTFITYSHNNETIENCIKNDISNLLIPINETKTSEKNLWHLKHDSISFNITHTYYNNPEEVKPDVLNFPTAIPKAIMKSITTFLNEHSFLSKEEIIKQHTIIYIDKFNFKYRENLSFLNIILRIDLKAIISEKKNAFSETILDSDFGKALPRVLAAEISQFLVPELPKSQPLTTSYDNGREETIEQRATF